jgi:hypothetical protein
MGSLSERTVEVKEEGDGHGWCAKACAAALKILRADAWSFCTTLLNGMEMTVMGALFFGVPNR